MDSSLQRPVQTQPSCADDYDPMSLSFEEALRRILDDIATVADTEQVDLRAGLDRVLGADVISPFDVPTHTNSAMDGYALIGTDLPAEGIAELRVIGTAFAGRPFAGEVSPGECVRIMTGAAMPDATDTVVIQERVERTDDRIRFEPHLRPGDNVRLAGEDIRRGQTVVRTGRRLTPADLGTLASLGVGTVTVRRRLRVAFMSTGDELKPIGEALGPGDVHDSNRYTLYGMLTRLGAEIVDLGIVRDDRAETRAAFEKAAKGVDMVITSGGVSVGEADYVKETLLALGSVQFWKVAMKPGRPLTFGRLGDAMFFGLPGNPVSVMVCFYLFVQPALQKLAGETAPAPMMLKARSQSRLKKQPGRVEYQRAVIDRDERGELVVHKTGMQGSGILTSMAQANCFIVLPVESATVEPGALVDVQLFAGLV
jgi:molybdopterin molybdotransferase